MNFDHNLLLVLDALLDERSVTRAAERLHLSQPAVSASLNRLRASFDDPLLVRGPRGMIPTPRALELDGPVKAILANTENLLHDRPFDPVTASTVYSVAADDYAQFAVVAPLLRRLRSIAPNIRLDVRIPDPHLEEQLERGQLDFAFTHADILPKGTRSAPLFDEVLTCAVRLDHPQVADRIDLDQFCALDHVSVSSAATGNREYLDQALRELGRRRRIVMTVPSYFILPRMLRHNDFLSIAPQRLIQYFAATLKMLPPPVSIPGFSVNLIWHERTQASAAHAWMRDLTVSLLHHDWGPDGSDPPEPG